MKVYIDYIFIENLVINYLLLFQTGKIIKQKIKVIKIILSSVVGAIYVCIMIALKIEILSYSICKMLLSVVMIYIAFTPKKTSVYLKELLVFYVVSIIATGTCLVIISMFNLNISRNIAKIGMYSMGIIVVYIIDTKLWKVFKLKVKKDRLVYDVYLNNKDKYVKYKGFIDTGNTAKDANSGRPIFFAEKRNNMYLSNKEKVMINVNTIQGKSVMLGYIFDNVIIKKEESIKFVDVVICFTENEIKNNLDCDMIMNCEVYEELLGGIYI